VLFISVGFWFPRKVVDQHPVPFEAVTEIMLLDDRGVKVTAKVAQQPRGCGDDVVSCLLMLTGKQVVPIWFDLNVEVVGEFLPSIIHGDVYVSAIGTLAIVATAKEFNVEVFHIGIGLAVESVEFDKGVEGFADFA
jgi:hypothetical protein